MSLEIYKPDTLKEACLLLAEKEGALPIAGGTDLLSRRERGIDLPPALICLDGLGLDTIVGEPAGGLWLGSLVTHAAVAGSRFIARWAPVLAEACRAVGSPQVRNLGSLGGNIGNASPAADTAPALLVMEAILAITGPNGERRLPVDEFFLGPGRTALQRGEILSGIILPAPAYHSAYLKLGLRRALEIALVGVAAALEMEGRLIKKCRIGLASVGPTPLRARQAEATLGGCELTPRLVEDAARTAAAECSPISDHRASGEYRRAMVELFVQRAIYAAAGRQTGGHAVPTTFSATKTSGNAWPVNGEGRAKLSPRLNLHVNNEIYSLDVATDKLLGDVLREDLGLTGLKIGCGEGECGACTVLLDGVAVNSCLILAVTVGNRKITTVEGLAQKGKLHPLQSAFIREGAVQCGYCTPGMLMSAAALLNDNPRGADEEEIKEALSGNLCRCTGYKKIIRAVHAAEKEVLFG